jgi:O-antigen ligase
MVFTRRNFDWWCERGILMFVLAALVFAPLAFGAVYVWTFVVLQFLVMGAAALWLVRVWAGYKPKLLWPPLAWAVAAFVVYAVARYFTADIPYVARQEVDRVLLYALLFAIITSNLYDQDSTEIIAFALTAVAALASSYALAQFFHRSNQVWNLTSPYPARASGTYINPDHFAGFLEMVLPLPLAFLMAGRVGIVTRVVLAYAALTIMGGLAVTFSRGGWIAATAGLLVLLGFLVCHKNHRIRALLILLLLLGGGSLFTIHVLSDSIGFMRRIVKPDDIGPSVVDTSCRLEMWTSAIEMCRDHPMLGVGPGEFDSNFRQYRVQGFQERPEHAHDDYLELLADWGLVGGAIVLAGMTLFAVGLGRSWPHVRREENAFGSGMSSRYAFFLGAVSGLCALMVHAFVDFNLHVAANALTAVTILALVVSNIRFATKRYWVRARLPIQIAVSAALVALITFLGIQNWRLAGEDYWTRKAEIQPVFSNAQADMLKKAVEFEPDNSLTAYNIGECFRVQSLDGGDNYEALGQKAIDFYQLGIKNNPHSELCQLRAGMTLDWLGRHADAEKYYAAAELLDPNGNFVVANIGWHYVQIARQWFMRANKLDPHNQIAQNYLQICQSKALDRASGRLPLSLFYQGKDN